MGTVSLSLTAQLYLFSFATCCWITLYNGRDPSWEIRVKGNLTRRADNGLINTSPISTMPPVVRLQRYCNHTIEIPGKEFLEHCLHIILILGMNQNSNSCTMKGVNERLFCT